MISLIKKYWAVIVGIIVSIIGILFLIIKTKKDVAVDKVLPEVKEKLDSNNNEIKIVDDQIEHIQEEKIEVKKKITEKKELVKILEESKQNMPEEVKTVAEAKKNILNKTKRRR
jgi:uncharacterized membrane-anchored protein YhcB (DUF1043 family)